MTSWTCLRRRARCRHPEACGATVGSSCAVAGRRQSKTGLSGQVNSLSAMRHRTARYDVKPGLTDAFMRRNVETVECYEKNSTFALHTYLGRRIQSWTACPLPTAVHGPGRVHCKMRCPGHVHTPSEVPETGTGQVNGDAAVVNGHGIVQGSLFRSRYRASWQTCTARRCTTKAPRQSCVTISARQ